MSDSVAVTTTPPPAALVPSSAYVAMSEEDSDIDDLVPGVDWIAASGKDGRFWLVSEDPKVSLGENLKVVVLHAAPGQTAWAPKKPDSADAVPHPDLEWFAQIGIQSGRPFCKNRDTKRLTAELSEDVNAQQLAALRSRGYTGNCHGCPFKKWNRDSKSSVCRESRELLLMVSGRPDAPARMTIDGTSLSPLKATLKKEFKVKVPGPDGKERLADLLIYSRPMSLSFKNEKNAAGQDYYVLVTEPGGFLPEHQVAEFRELRETFLQYSQEFNAAASQQYVDEPADHEIPATSATSDDVPPPTDADAPPTVAEVANKYFQ